MTGGSIVFDNHTGKSYKTNRTERRYQYRNSPNNL